MKYVSVCVVSTYVVSVFVVSLLSVPVLSLHMLSLPMLSRAVFWVTFSVVFSVSAYAYVVFMMPISALSLSINVVYAIVHLLSVTILPSVTGCLFHHSFTGTRFVYLIPCVW